MKCKMVWNKRISQCLFMEQVNWVTQVPHIESLLFLQTTARSVVFLILGTLYTSRISIFWVFPGLTGHWWPISSYHKGEFLFYTSDIKIVKFLAKKSIYSLVNIELQKYYQDMGKIQCLILIVYQLLTPGNKKPTLVDKLPRNGEWVDLNISSKSPCICWKQSINIWYLAPVLQENVATITICDVNRAVLRISRQYRILFL